MPVHRLIYLAAIAMAGCSTPTQPETMIAVWNAEVTRQKSACEKGQVQACQTLCRMSQEKKICTDVAAIIEPDNDAQRAWVSQCPTQVAAQGAVACQMAAGVKGVAEQPIAIAQKTPSPPASAEVLAHQRKIEPEQRRAAEAEQAAREATSSAASSATENEDVPKAINRTKPKKANRGTPSLAGGNAATDTASKAVTPSPGYLSVNSMPAADVQVDGRSIGRTPIVRHPLPAGKHDVVLRHGRFGPRVFHVNISSGKTEIVTTRF